jgi:type IV pilus assembly protein PilE
MIKNHFRKLPAFTLSELLVVLVIIGILVLLALPSLMPLISRARGLEAKQALKHLHTLQKAHYYEFSRFTDDMVMLGFEQENLVTDEENPGNANYLVEIAEVSATSYKAIATSVVDFDGDGVYNQWEINEKGQLIETVKD